MFIWIFFLAPILLATVVAIYPKLNWKILLFLIVVILLTEIITYDYPPNWERKYILSIWFFGLIMPWVVEAIYFYNSKNWDVRIWRSVGAIALYYMTVLTFLYLGIVFGLVYE